MEGWQKGAQAVIRMSAAGRNNYFKKFPERREWFEKNHPEHFGRSASVATTSLTKVNNAKIAAQKIADMRYKKALVSSSDRVREMGRRRREGGEGLGGGLESNKDIIQHVKQYGSIKAGRLGEETENIQEVWGVVVPYAVGLGVNILRGGLIARRAALARNVTAGPLRVAWEASKGAGREIAAVPRGIVGTAKDLAYAVRHPIQATKNAFTAQGRLKPSAGWSTDPRLNQPYGPGPGVLKGKKLTGGNVLNPAGKYSITSPAGVAALATADYMAGAPITRTVGGILGASYRKATGLPPAEDVNRGPASTDNQSGVPNDGAGSGGDESSEPSAPTLGPWVRDEGGYGKGTYDLPGGVGRHWASDPTKIDDTEDEEKRLREQEESLQECMPMMSDYNSKEEDDVEEKGEYDYEGDMAKSQLRSIGYNAKMLHDMLEDNTNLPEWVQSKITLAEDYILTAANYMRGEMEGMNEDVELINEGPSHFRYTGEVNGKPYEYTVRAHSDLTDNAVHRALKRDNDHLEPHEIKAVVQSGGEEESHVEVEHNGKKYTHHVINEPEPDHLYEENEGVELINEGPSHFRYTGEVNGKSYEYMVPAHTLEDLSDNQLRRILKRDNDHLESHEIMAIVNSGGDEESQVDVTHKGKSYTHHVINDQEPQSMYIDEATSFPVGGGVINYDPRWEKSEKSKPTLGADYHTVPPRSIGSPSEREYLNRLDLPFDPTGTRNPGPVKDKSGAVHTQMSDVRHRAKMALKAQIASMQQPATAADLVNQHLGLHEPLAKEAEQLDEFKVPVGGKLFGKKITDITRSVPKDKKIVGGRIVPPGKPPKPPVASSAIPEPMPGKPAPSQKNPKDMTAAEYQEFHKNRSANRKAVDQMSRNLKTGGPIGPSKRVLQNPYAGLDELDEAAETSMTYEKGAYKSNRTRPSGVTTGNMKTNPGFVQQKRDKILGAVYNANKQNPYTNLSRQQTNAGNEALANELLGFEIAKGEKVKGREQVLGRVTPPQPTPVDTNDLVNREALPSPEDYSTPERVAPGHGRHQAKVEKARQQAAAQLREEETAQKTENASPFVDAASKFLTRTSARLVYGEKND